MTNAKIREQFEAAIIERFKESAFTEVEIRVECLGRSAEGYRDSSVDAYWHFWKASREAVVVPLPDTSEMAQRAAAGNEYSAIRIEQQARCRAAIEAQGLRVAP